MHFAAAESAYTDNNTERCYLATEFFCSSVQLNQLILILILSAVIERQSIACSSLQLNQLILILILSAVFKRQSLVCLDSS